MTDKGKNQDDIMEKFESAPELADPSPGGQTHSMATASTLAELPTTPSTPTPPSVAFRASSNNPLIRNNSSKSKLSHTKSFQTIRSVATRIKVANQLSIAKRTGDSVSILGGALPDSNVPQNLPPLSSITKKLYTDFLHADEQEMACVKEGVISGGELVFDNDFKSTSRRRPYIYVMPDVEAKNVTNIMLTEWKLPLPRIAVFILSGVSELNTWHNSRQIAAFKKGLMKAANTTSMWLFTNGLDVGIAKLIGDAIERELKEKRTFRYHESKRHKHNDNDLHVIGITNNHNLAYSQQFFGKHITLGSVGPNTAENRYELNQEHTNFVVLNSVDTTDNGHNRLLINLIDYLTKNAGRSVVDELPNDVEPLYHTAKSNFTTLTTFNDRFSSSNAASNSPPIIANVFIDGQCVQLAELENDTVDCLTTPDTSGAPAPPETASLSRISHQISVLTAGGDTLIPESAAVTRQPSFVHESNVATPSEPNLPPLAMEPPMDSYAPSDQPEKPLSAARAATLLQSTIVPVVCLVIQGGYECAKLVLDNLRRRNPVIVLRGSGGFADLLSFAYLEMQQRCRDLYSGWDPEFVEHTLKPLLTLKIVKRFPHFQNNQSGRNLFRDRIIECVRQSGSSKGRVFLSVLNMHNSSCNLENLSEYILLSLFKSQNRRDTLDANLIRKDLYLTLDWNCSHVALDEVLRRNPSYNLQVEKSIFEMALLRENREDFVDLFLSHGFRIHKYLTPFRLRRLIQYSLSESEFFRSVCMENILGIAAWSINFEEVIEKLSLSASESIDADSFITNEFNQLIYTCSSLRNFVQVEHLYLNIMGLYPVDVETTERKVLAILAMWAVFNQRVKLAQVLWKYSDQPIHLGLILSMMLDRMVWFIPEQNLKDELSEHSKMFAQFAIGVLDACYRQDEKRSFDLLSQENSDWDQKTAVDIAANGKQRAFIAHPCCQKWLTFTFNGSIRVRELSWGIITVSPMIKIILSAFFIFPMYIWIRFLDQPSLSEIKRKSLSDFNQPPETDQSESEEDKFLSDHIKLIELNRNKVSDSQHNNGGHSEDDHTNNKNQGFDNKEQWQQTLDQLKNGQFKENRGTFRQQKFFIKRQPPLWTMINLMWNSPITKFWTYQVFYIFYLAIFSLAVIWPGCGNWYLDSTVCLWTFLNLVEHIGRTVHLFRRYTSVPMVFKVFEMLGLILLLVIYSLGRVFTYNDRSFENIFDPYTMKVILSLGLLYHYYRLFAIHLPISPTLGPLLYRFQLMVTVDFIHFMRMALILLISSGIVIQAVLYPNTELSTETFHKAFHRSVISMFLTPVEELTVKCNRTSQLQPSSIASSRNSTSLDRKFFLPNLRPDQCPSAPIPMSESCPRTGFWPYFFSFQFLIFLKLILMTLLYALFASTASKLQTETDNIWKFQRYTLVIDFANRPPLHAPLSIFVYFYRMLVVLYRLLTCKCCTCGRSKKDHVDHKVLIIPDNNDEAGNRLSLEDYNFWRHLAKMFYEDEQRKKDKSESNNRQNEVIQMICEEMEHGKHVMRAVKTKLSELERMIYQSHIYLEEIQTATVSSTDMAEAARLTQSMSRVHRLSRHSPYVGTRIQRFPIADKFVCWNVIWINYDPVIYSRKREDFPAMLKPFVDEDILAIKERLNSHKSDTSLNEPYPLHLPVFNWNAISLNPAGLTIDRRSCLRAKDIEPQYPLTTKMDYTEQAESNRTIIYKLEESIPLNPFGRTGLRGKGNLPRWGPNHYVILILTRSNASSVQTHEVAIEMRSSSVSLPMRFVGDDKPFKELRQLFADEDPQQPQSEWSNEEDIVQYCKRKLGRHASSISITCEPPSVHYMDSPDNTDNAWKEFRLYHIHFECSGISQPTDNLLKPGSIATTNSMLIWLIANGDIFVRIPLEQVTFMSAVIHRLQSGGYKTGTNDSGHDKVHHHRHPHHHYHQHKSPKVNK